jgi:hypothetical protein
LLYWGGRRRSSVPSGYSAYCVYIPSGTNIDFEKRLLSRLEEFGKESGDVIYVASWNTGVSTYVKLMQDLNIKERPALILTSSWQPNKQSLKIILRGKALKNIELLMENLPPILDLIVMQDKKAAIKKTMKFERTVKLRSLVNGLESVMRNLKLTISWNGLTVEPTKAAL